MQEGYLASDDRIRIDVAERPRCQLDFSKFGSTHDERIGDQRHGRSNCVADLLLTRHPSREDQWLAGRCRLADQGEISELEGRHLEARTTQTLQVLHPFLVEDGGEQGDAGAPGVGEEIREPLARRMRLTVELVYFAASPQPLGQHLVATTSGLGKLVRIEALELNSISASVL